MDRKLKVNDTVTHKTKGVGTVLCVDDHTPMAVVKFDRCTGWFLFAELEKVEEQPCAKSS